MGNNSIATKLLKKLKEASPANVTFLVLTNAPDSETVRHFEEAGKKLKVKLYTVVADGAYISEGDRTKATVSNFNGDNDSIDIEPENTCVIVRGSALTTASITLIDIFESLGCFLVNSKETMLLCRNKVSTGYALNKAKVNTPPFIMISHENQIEAAIEVVGGFPVILKILDGSEGIGVIKVEGASSLKSTLQALWKNGAEVFIQKYIPIKYDTRVLVLGGEVLAAMKRIIPKGDFRANVALGGTSKPVKLSKEEIKIAIEAAQAVGAYYCGVDIVDSKDGCSILEVNGSPGSGADYMMADGKVIDGLELTLQILKYIKESKDEWVYPKDTAGTIEWVHLNGEKLKAKLDTGNEGYSVLHAVDIEADKKKVTFKLLGNKSMTKDIVDFTTVRSSFGDLEKRPVVEFDIKFNGRTYNNVRFSLTDRSENDYTVLISADFLKKFRYKVDPDVFFNLK